MLFLNDPPPPPPLEDMPIVQMAVIDSASKHPSEANLVAIGLEPEAGGTHIGMFLAWAILNNLVAEWFEDE